MNGYFKVISIRVVDELDFQEEGGFLSQRQAIVKVKLSNRKIIEAAEGAGPIEAIFNALLKILAMAYPVLDEIKLAGYEPEVMDIGQDGAASIVKSILTFNHNGTSLTVEGKSRDIIESGALAIINGLNYFLAEYFKKAAAGADNKIKAEAGGGDGIY